jgi:hypothetical protein
MTNKEIAKNLVEIPGDNSLKPVRLVELIEQALNEAEKRGRDSVLMKGNSCA